MPIVESSILHVFSCCWCCSTLNVFRSPSVVVCDTYYSVLRTYFAPAELCILQWLDNASTPNECTAALERAAALEQNTQYPDIALEASIADCSARHQLLQDVALEHVRTCVLASLCCYQGRHAGTGGDGSACTSSERCECRVKWSAKSSGSPGECSARQTQFEIGEY